MTKQSAKKLWVAGLALSLAACAAQESALQSSGAQAPEAAPAETADSAAARRESRRDQPYVTSLERRDKTGSRINRVRRRGEPDEDTTAGKRVETVSREELENIERRSGGPVISGNE